MAEIAPSLMDDNQQNMKSIGELLETVITDGVDAIDSPKFSILWEAIKTNRHVAIAWLVRKTIENLKTKDNELIIGNFCDFVLKYFGRRYIAFAFDLLAMSIRTMGDDNNKLTILASMAKSSVYCNQDKLKSAASGLVGAYYYRSGGGYSSAAI